MDAHRRSVLCRWVRQLARKGWSVGDIANVHHVSKADVLSMLAPVVKPPPNPRYPGACFKKPNAWSEMAATDPRYRDRLELLEAPTAAVERPELVDPPAVA